MNKNLWDQIVGHGETVEALMSAVNSGKLPHALLFRGIEGIGKRKTALTLAAALNCSSNGCGACSECRSIMEMENPWVTIIDSDKEAIGVEEAKTITALTALKPPHGKHLVIIIDGVERMTGEAVNALLKVLEEPPSKSIIIGITARPNNILPTIVSRCRGIPFNPLSNQELKEITSSSFSAEEWLLDLAEGSAGRAFYWMSEDRQIFLREITALWNMCLEKEKVKTGSLWLGLKQLGLEGNKKNISDLMVIISSKLRFLLRNGLEKNREQALKNLIYLQNCWESLKYNVDVNFISKLIFLELNKANYE